MRSALIVLMVALGLSMPTFAQQPDSSKKTPKEKKESKQPESSANVMKPEAKPTPPGAPPSEPAKPEAGPGEKGPAEKEEHYDMTEVAPVVTHHQVTVGGKSLSYAATAGRLPLKRGDGKTEAQMFFVAYTLDGQDAGKRPVTFAFNGGPGSASIWLHGCAWPEACCLTAERVHARGSISA
jgi:carboxypeptidase C (cathepsin A)